MLSSCRGLWGAPVPPPRIAASALVALANERASFPLCGGGAPRRGEARHAHRLFGVDRYPLLLPPQQRSHLAQGPRAPDEPTGLACAERPARTDAAEHRHVPGATGGGHICRGQGEARRRQPAAHRLRSVPRRDLRPALVPADRAAGARPLRRRGGDAAAGAAHPRPDGSRRHGRQRRPGLRDLSRAAARQRTRHRARQRGQKWHVRTSRALWVG